MAIGEKGTRNLKQEVSSWATKGSTDDEWDLGPSRESRSEGVALREGFGEDRRGKIGEDEEAEME